MSTQEGIASTSMFLYGQKFPKLFMKMEISKEISQVSINYPIQLKLVLQMIHHHIETLICYTYTFFSHFLIITNQQQHG